MSRRTVAALAIVLALAGANRATAFDDYTGRHGRVLSAYGQLSLAGIHVDDGVGGKSAGVDNTHSVSRVGLVLRRQRAFGEFRFRFETSLGLRQSDQVSQTWTGPAVSWTRGDIRYLDFILDRGSAGTYSIGHGSMATDQVMTADLSGTKLANSVSVPDMAGGFEFRTIAGALSGIAVDDAYKTFDGIRRARIRYDRAFLKGFKFSVSAGAEILEKNNDELNLDVSVTYRGTVGDFQMEGAAGASITRQVRVLTRADIVGSFSALHVPSGLSLTVASAVDDGNSRLAYLKIGYLADIFSVGPTALSADTYVGKNISVAGSRSKAWGLALVQHLPRPNVQVYLGVRKYDYDDATVAIYRPVKAVMFGTRWQF